MKTAKITFIVLYLTAIAFLIDCTIIDDQPNTPQQTENQDPKRPFYRILPLGDSRVEGATPNSVSYRYELWKQLTATQWGFNYIGTQLDNSNYPLYLNHTFDPDHQGIGGYKTEDILNTIEDILDQIKMPDVVLIGIGGNDLASGKISVSEAINNINETIDILQNHNPNIVVFIEQIAPAKSSIMSSQNTYTLNLFNNNIALTAENQTSDTSKVIAIDMFSNWNDSYMADNLHYNALGAQEVANRYYNSINKFLAKE